MFKNFLQFLVVFHDSASDCTTVTLEYEQLAQRTAQATDRFQALSDKIKTVETAMNANNEIAQYSDHKVL
jgi:septal ring factor EnvC (AmiA/AmiB activator)